MKNSTIYLPVLFLLSVLGLTACGTTTEEAAHAHSDGHSHAVEGATIIEADYAFSPSDAQATLDFADEVLVVTIDDSGESFIGQNVPLTDFSATVVASLTDNVLPGESVTVQQEGGVIDGEVLMFEEQPRLEEGSVYVIAGRMSDGTIHVLPGVGSEVVEGPVAGSAALAEWALLGVPGNGKFEIPDDLSSE